MRYVAALAVLFGLTSPVSSHHSDAGMDMNSVVTFEGTVTQFNWRNPHVYFTVEITEPGGGTVEWTLQTESGHSALRSGQISRDFGPSRGLNWVESPITLAAGRPLNG